MVKITNWYDIVSANSNGQISEALARFAAEQFRGLHKHLGEGSSLFQFDLANHGPLWVTTTGEISLSWEQITKTLQCESTEFVERHVLTDQTVAFRVGFLADNDYMPILVALAENLEETTLEYLQEESCEAISADDFGNNPF